MTPTETSRVIEYAFSQWPAWAPHPDAVIIWSAALADFEFGEVLPAVQRCLVSSSKPPAVADVLAELGAGADPLAGFDSAWLAVSALIAGGAFRSALVESDFPCRRSFVAALSVASALRVLPDGVARLRFRDAWADTPPDAAGPALAAPSCVGEPDCVGGCRGLGMWLDEFDRVHRCDGVEVA